MTKSEYATIESAIEDLADEIQEAKSVLAAMTTEVASVKRRQDEAKQVLSIAKYNLRFLKSEAQVVMLEKYRDARKLIKDTLKNLEWLKDELHRHTAARDSLQLAVQNLEKELNKYKKELSQWGQIYHYRER
jgi:chromosome segregation ATPase